MNLDELLKTVWTAEANNQATGSVDYGPAAQQPGQPVSGSSLNQQSSLMLPTDLSKKTVDEVWQDIQQGHKRGSLDRKATLGEMTLEDFLVKAGVVAESSAGKRNSGLAVGGADPMGLPQQAQWMNYQIPSVHSQQQQQQQHSMLPVFMPGHPVQQPIPLCANPIMDAAYPETQITMSSSPVMGTLSDTQTPGRKRVAPDDIAEKSVERRQKRMIKNRESAARSRARKQAYTHELENKVSRLEEENERLKRQKMLYALPKVSPVIFTCMHSHVKCPCECYQNNAILDLTQKDLCFSLLDTPPFRCCYFISLTQSTNKVLVLPNTLSSIFKELAQHLTGNRP
ncbi:UNVERIFIED_CONTAM: ABSCISIC ACID-INSENSITIVE 5-like protein 2 [Sesamum radiatum]|uniref:ABSCISIC ACID-INSENSITIVE 5-like protein 2 n=1 Tax=Sesamum radiatum TaxID=300843 RepID=A0AAW2TJU3_SESRA